MLQAYGTDWLYVAVPALALLGVHLHAVRRGWAAAGAQAPGDPRWRRTARAYGISQERLFGLPSWASAGLAAGSNALLLAALGFYWDVDWHIDRGRDAFLFTPPHVLILLGLLGVAGSLAVLVTVASAVRADLPLRWRGVRAPLSAVPLAALAGGALAGFPLDDLWHAAYGTDVTMWGPTHLLMIGGAAFSPLCLALLVGEGRRRQEPAADADTAARRARRTRVATYQLSGAVLTGLSAFQLEFDLGVPQWQQLYHPVLIALATGGLVFVRRAGGRGSALVAVAIYSLQRLLIATWLGVVLHRGWPSQALYLPEALIIEVAFAGGLARRRAGRAPGASSPLVRAAVCGLLVGTVGTLAEGAWTHLVGYQPWGLRLLPSLPLTAAAGVAAAVLGVTAARALRGYDAAPAAAVGGAAAHPGTADRLPAAARPGRRGPRRVLVGGAAAVAVGALVVPFHKAPAGVPITVHAALAGPFRTAVSVDVAPRTVRDADWFEVMAYQGDGFAYARLHQTAPGHYVAAQPVPFGGKWKVMVRLARGPVLAAAAVSMPADPTVGAPAIPLAGSRTSYFARDSRLLMREAHSGATWPALVAYGAVGAVAATWAGALAWGYGRVAASGHGPGPGAPPAAGGRQRTAALRRKSSLRLPARPPVAVGR